jgi:hypothetical protein
MQLVRFVAKSQPMVMQSDSNRPSDACMQNAQIQSRVPIPKVPNECPFKFVSFCRRMSVHECNPTTKARVRTYSGEKKWFDAVLFDYNT